MFVFFLCLSLIVFVFGLINAISLKKSGKIPWQSFLLLLLLFTAVAMWLAVMPLVEKGSILYKPLYAAFYVLESAVANVDYSLFSERLGSISFWRIYTILLHLLMPITAFGSILFYFLKIFGWFRYTLFRGNQEIILFSNLTDKTKAYAKRIDTKNKLLIFCNTEDTNKESFDEDRSRNMIFTGQSEIQMLKQLQKRNLTIMEMGENEERNLQKSVEIIQELEKCSENKTPSPVRQFLQKYIPETVFENEIFKMFSDDLTDEDKKTISLCTVSGHPEAAAIMDNLMKRGTMTPLLYKQTTIDEYKRIAFRLLHDDPLYQLVDEDTEKLDILIVGFGRMGREVLKAISWAGCFPDTDTNVHVVSRHGIESGKQLLSECPELGVDLLHKGGFEQPENGGVQINKDAPIYYYSTETKGLEFDEIIRSLAHCRYIVVSLGDDSETLETALRIYHLIMRECYLKDRSIIPPEIHVRIRDDENLKLFSAEDVKSAFASFKKFGSDKDIYGADRISESELEIMAVEARKIYMEQNNLQDKEWAAYEYLSQFGKNANQAAGLHALYKLHFMKKVKADRWNPSEPKDLLESQRVFNTLVSYAEKEKIANWEHIRWQAYMRTEGFVHAPYEKTKELYDSLYKGNAQKAAARTREELLKARIHPTIGDNETHLKAISRLLGDPNDENYYHKNDLRFVRSIPDLISAYYRVVPSVLAGGLNFGTAAEDTPEEFSEKEMPAEEIPEEAVTAENAPEHNASEDNKAEENPAEAVTAENVPEDNASEDDKAEENPGETVTAENAPEDNASEDNQAEEIPGEAVTAENAPEDNVSEDSNAEEIPEEAGTTEENTAE